MDAKIGLTSEEILNKTFKGALRGYDALEVDEFLDKIIADYEFIEQSCLVLKSNVESSEKKEADLKQKIKELEIELASYKTKFANIKPTDVVTSDNIDYICRINALEKYLYEHGIDPNEIK